jgi:hypothetical protein
LKKNPAIAQQLVFGGAGEEVLSFAFTPPSVSYFTFAAVFHLPWERGRMNGSVGAFNSDFQTLECASVDQFRSIEFRA